MNEFLSDIVAIRDHALVGMSDGPLTSAYKADPAAVIAVLNDVVATEMVCWLRYTQHSITAAGIDRRQVTEEFVEHAGEELQHLMWAAERINQLGGSPDLDPSTLVSRSQTTYRVYPGADLVGMLRENLLAERIVIQTYQEIVRWLGTDDPTSRRIIERILEQEEDHADDLRDLLGDLADPQPGL